MEYCDFKLEHGIEKCRVCEHYYRGLDTCKFCSFEWATNYPPCDDWEWDILDIDEDIEWNYLQILDRLHAKGVPCLFADIWRDDMLYLVGCNAFSSKIAEVLGVHEESVYNQSDQAFVIVNLYQEKCIRRNEDEIYGE